jgi:phosphoribosyl 1,2-cyclic phosphate phosphodiesterase
VNPAPLELTFLGTGTSFGIPVVGCECETCTSTDPRDARDRHAAFLRLPGGGRLLVDAPPELRLQLVRARIAEVDAVWLTHLHADHLHGIDDLRIFSMRTGRPLPVYLPAEAHDTLVHRFDYIFTPWTGPDDGTTRPELTLHPVDPHKPLELLGHEVVPLEVPHGRMRPLGFRVGPLGYITDAKRLTPPVLERLQGVRVLVLNALWYGNPHPNHFNVEEACAAAEAVGAETTFLTHLTHRLRHAPFADALPPGVMPAWDGLTVRIHPGGALEMAASAPAASAQAASAPAASAQAATPPLTRSPAHSAPDRTASHPSTLDS